MNKKIIFISLLILILIPNVLAERYITNYGKEGKIINGQFQATSTSVSNFYAYGYVCSNDICDFQSHLWNGNNLPSSGNYITLTYPTQLQSPYGYGVIFFKDGYIPYEVNDDYWGTDSSDPQTHNIYLSKKDICSATIDSFSVINEAKPYIPIVINTTVALDATTHSALQNAGPLHYIPPHLQSHYSVETEVTLEIFKDGQLIYEANEELSIPYSGSEDVEFTWIPTESGNNYIAKVSTYVTDAKCLDSTEEYSQKNFVVLEEEPRNMCYTLLNDLEVSHPNPKIGDQLTFTVEKISNYADNNQNLFPTQTQLMFEVRKGTQLIKQETKTLSNQNPQETTFNWNTNNAQPGQYNIIVRGIALDPICNTVTNQEEIVSMTLTLETPPNVCTSRTDVEYGSWSYQGGNQPPTAIIQASTSQANRNQAITFNAQNSYDSDGSITSYQWNFGDGSTSTSSITQHAYTTSGNKQVTLTVRDNGGNQVRHRTNTHREIETCSDGSTRILSQWTEEEYETIIQQPLTSTTSTTINIINNPPSLNIPNINFDEDTIYILNLNNYASDPENDPLSFTASSSNIDVNINNGIATLTPHLNYNGQTTITFTANDGSSSTSQTIIAIINPINDPPIISDIPDLIINDNQIYTLNLNNYVNDVDNDVITWSFSRLSTTNFVDITLNNNIASFQATSSNRFIFTYPSESFNFIASDSFLTDSDDMTVSTNNLYPPVARAGFDRTVKKNEVFELDAGRSYDLDGYIALYQWNLKDGRIINQEKFQLSYPIEGTYNVELTVTDNDNLSSTDTIIITVSDKPLYSKTHKFSINNKITDFQSYNPGDEFESLIRLRNLGHMNEENLEVSLDVHELDIHEILLHNFNLDSNQVKAIPINFIIPYNAEPGEYLAKITVTSDDYKTYSYSTILIE